MVSGKGHSKVKSCLQSQCHTLKVSNNISSVKHRGQCSERIIQNSEKSTNNTIFKDFKEKGNKIMENNITGLKDKNNIITSKQHSEEDGKILNNNADNAKRDCKQLENKGAVSTKVLETSLKEKVGLFNNNNKLDDKTKILTSKSFQNETKHNEYDSKRMIKPNVDIHKSEIFNEFILVLKENQQFIDTEQHDTKARFLTIMKDYINNQNEISSSRTSRQTRKRKSLRGCKKIVGFDSNIDIREFRGSSPVAQTKTKELHKKLNLGDTENID